MKKIKELKYEEFKELLGFLKEKHETPVELLAALQKFFPSLTAIQEMELMYVIESINNNLETSEELFNGFVEKYPEIDIDETGKSEPAKRNYWELELETLELMYKNSMGYLAEHKKDLTTTKVHEQTVNAKTLECLQKMPKSAAPYLYRRTLYIKKNPLGIQPNEFDKAEAELKTLGISREVLGVFLAYLDKNKKEITNTFVKHFFSRLLLATKDTENEVNKEFINELKKIKIE